MVTENIDPESIRQKVAQLIQNFENELRSEELRPKVLALVPVFHEILIAGVPILTNLGSLIRILL